MPGLVYAGCIVAIDPIEGADRIELATVVCGEGGKWNGVVARGEYTVGDTATVYLQDAVVPPSDSMKFLEKHDWRVRMARFRGAPSECVVVPLCGDYDVGTDLTELLGVTKYVKCVPSTLNGVPCGNFPSFIPKTDEPNFQTAYRLVDAIRGQPWYATVKADGSSTTAYRLGDHFGVCSRNLELGDSEGNGLWRIAREYDLRERLPDGIALQWETVGPGIQKNPLGLGRIEPRAFDAYLIKEQRYMSRCERSELCAVLKFPTVDEIICDLDFDLDKTSMQEMARGHYASGKVREGIVIRPVKEQWVGQSRLSFKVINLDYKD